MREDFYLRFVPAEQRVWLRRHLFSLGYSRVFRMEEASPFDSREQAIAFAQQYHLERDVELVELKAEALDAA